jgi:hypothetical protein
LFSTKISKDKLTAEKYLQWVEQPKNGLRVQKTIEDYEYDAQYKPVEYILLKENRHLTQDALVKQKKALEALDYFTLRLSNISSKDFLKGNVSNKYSYQEILNYYAYEMQKDIQLIEGSDTIKCALYHFERNYGLAPFRSFVLGFERISRQSDEDKILIIHNRIANQGIVKMRINSIDLNAVPTVAL